MMHGHGITVPETRKQIVQGAVAKASRGRGRFHGWRELEAEDRIALVESALSFAANDFADELPLAL